MLRPFRFGVATSGAPRHEWLQFASRVEALGFSVLLVPDHYVAPFAPAPLLVAAAGATTTLRVGALVYDNDFRHPALLAKEAASIDVMTDGRFELGIGAGWHKPEYDQVGLPFDPPGVRASRLEEAVDVILRLLTGDEVTFQGEHYHLEGLRGVPAPVQSPVPLFIGAGGPRLLRLAGRRAQIVGLAARSKREGGIDEGDLTAEAMDDKAAWVEESSAGRDDAPERNLLIQGVLPSLDVARERLRGFADTAAASPHFFIGSTDEVAAQVEATRERWGISYFVCFDRDLDAFAPVVERLSGT